MEQKTQKVFSIFGGQENQLLPSIPVGTGTALLLVGALLLYQYRMLVQAGQ